MRPTRWLWIFALSGMAFGQSNPVNSPVTPGKAAPTLSPAASATDYSAEPIVIERLEHLYRLAADGTGTLRETVVARVQSDSSVRQLGVVGVAFAASSQRVEIGYVRARHPDGTVTETPVSQAMEVPSPVTTAAPFYSDLKQMQIPVRNLRVGDKLEWQATIVRTKAEAPGQSWGQESFVQDGVVLSEVLELHIPKGIQVNVWSPGSKATETVDGADRLLRWESAQLKPSVGKAAEEEKERRKKQVLNAAEEIDQEQGKLPDVAWSTFPSWEAVGAWYRALESDRIAPDAEVKAKVAELIAGKTSEEDKVRAVYGYVATQIRYIGVDFGIGRYQPHHASEVLENQYGDCKDKHTLLAAMLSVLGLHPEAVLIGAGIRFNEAVPSPAAFNHLITSVEVNGQRVWLDSTSEVAPYRALQFAIRDKQALRVPESGAATIQRTPDKLPFDSFEKLDAEGSLDTEGISNSHMVMTLRGDDELALRGAFRSISPAQYDEMMQRISQGMRYAGTVSQTEVSHLDDTLDPLRITYQYKREKAGDWDNRRIIPQLAPVLLPGFTDTDPPTQSIILGVPHVETSSSAMKLPEGWGAQLPEAVHQKCEYATYDQTYRFDKGTVYSERRIEILKYKVPLADYKAYKKWTEAVDLGSESYIQLTNTSTKKLIDKNESKSVAPAGGAPSGTSVANAKSETMTTTAGSSVPPVAATASGPSIIPSNAEAAKLVASGYQFVQRRDWEEAKAKLDSAKAINEEQAWLWSTYAYVELGKYQLPTATEDFEKELTLHPDTFNSYPELAMTQKTMNKRSEAKETLHRWAMAYPENPQPTIRLMEMLLEDEDAVGAVNAAKAGIAKLPEDKKSDESLQLILGRAQIQAGMNTEGTATLLALMKSSSDAGMMNDSAYELADAGKEVPLAESTARAALAKLETESKTWTLDENPQMLAGRSRLIVATWDTLGWALFREGKIDESKSYLHAAWSNRPSLEIGKHLGELQAAGGDKAGAYKTYELAIESEPAYDMLGVRKQPGALQRELMHRLQEGRKSDPHAPAVKERTTPQQLRTFQLGPSKGLSGTAEYRLLLGQGKVLKAEQTGDKSVPGGIERVRQAELPVLFPTGSDAQLVRTGMLTCHGDICELVLEP